MRAVPSKCPARQPPQKACVRGLLRCLGPGKILQPSRKGLHNHLTWLIAPEQGYFYGRRCSIAPDSWLRPTLPSMPEELREQVPDRTGEEPGASLLADRLVERPRSEIQPPRRPI